MYTKEQRACQKIKDAIGYSFHDISIDHPGRLRGKTFQVTDTNSDYYFGINGVKVTEIDGEVYVYVILEGGVEMPLEAGKIRL